MARLGRLTLAAAIFVAFAALLGFKAFVPAIPTSRLQRRCPALVLGHSPKTYQAPRSTRLSRPALPTLLAAGGAAALLLRQVVQRLGSNDSALRDLISKHTNILIVDDFTNSDSVDSPVLPEPRCRANSADELHWYVAPNGDGLPPVRWILKKPSALQRVLLEGGLGFAESYIDGDWDTDDLERLVFEMLKLENVRSELGWRVMPLLSMIFWGALKWKILPGNSLKGAQSNIANTYDVLNSPKLYEIMLGPTMQYTCAYYPRPDMSLDEAQEAKMDLIAKKLDLKPGMRCLEFGFGFGAQAQYLASKYGVHVTGVTLSREQMAWAVEHNAHPNIEYRFQDYREVTGKFDRIYSVGMFEHVGRNSYETFFDKCYELLKDDGIMLIHTMGWARRGPWNHNAFVNKYIFPGGEMPTMSHMTMEYSDRWHMEDWHSFGKSYVMTLRCWLERIRDWKGLDELDNRFRRMWVYYLCACAAAFERRRVKLWQITYTKLNSTRPDDCLHIRNEASPEMAASTAA